MSTDIFLPLAMKAKVSEEGQRGDQKPAFAAIKRAFYIISLGEH